MFCTLAMTPLKAESLAWNVGPLMGAYTSFLVIHPAVMKYMLASRRTSLNASMITGEPLVVLTAVVTTPALNIVGSLDIVLTPATPSSLIDHPANSIDLLWRLV